MSDPVRSPGFTLVEVLVAATLSALVLVTVHALLSTSTRVADAVGDERAVEAEVEDLLARLRSDVEGGRIVAAAGSTLTVAGGPDTVTYAWSGLPAGVLVRGIGAEADTVSHRVTDLVFAPRIFTYDTIIEAVSAVSFPIVAAGFEPGDWDDIVAADPFCSYLSDGQFTIVGTEWMGLTFQTNSAITSFVGARILASRPPAASGNDLILEIYRARGTPPYDPEIVLAQAHVNTGSLSSTPEWVSGTFVPIDPTPVPSTTALWLVARGLNSGSGRVARVQFGRLTCPAASAANGITSYTTSDAGGTWSAKPDTEEFYFVIDATHDVEGLSEVTSTHTDTTGVQITIAVTGDTTTEERVLEIAGIDL